MNKSAFTTGVVLVVISLISAETFILLRTIVQLETMVSDAMLAALGKLCFIAAAVILLALVIYMLYSYIKAYRGYHRKLIIIGHDQPNSNQLTKIYNEKYGDEVVEPVVVPGSFIGSVLPKTRLQLQRIRGSWFFPTAHIMVTFNAKHLQTLNEDELRTHLHDIQAILKDLTWWQKDAKLLLVVHNMNCFAGYSLFEKYGIEDTRFWQLSHDQQFSHEFEFYRTEALHKQTKMSANDFIDIVNFFYHIDQTTYALNTVFNYFQQLAQCCYLTRS
ncbi:hypothetical protein [Zooshikella ganghwensis]|uniref:Uncharacterized protein n=1 Tax=Zooshikella ganghwensis TaxID=202772 RepID=A0A4P9VLS8_9GAMM|nr:hypothetical protein [Zooshikella ganghwensis]RDH42832.1 hypothetical protein B9G39_04850 [Zooshikella ganghwensis]